MTPSGNGLPLIFRASNKMGNMFDDCEINHKNVYAAGGNAEKIKKEMNRKEKRKADLMARVSGFIMILIASAICLTSDTIGFLLLIQALCQFALYFGAAALFIIGLYFLVFGDEK